MPEANQLPYAENPNNVFPIVKCEFGESCHDITRLRISRLKGKTNMKLLKHFHEQCMSDGLGCEKKQDFLEVQRSKRGEY